MLICYDSSLCCYVNVLWPSPKHIIHFHNVGFVCFLCSGGGKSSQRRTPAGMGAQTGEDQEWVSELLHTHINIPCYYLNSVLYPRIFNSAHKQSFLSTMSHFWQKSQLWRIPFTATHTHIHIHTHTHSKTNVVYLCLQVRRLKLHSATGMALDIVRLSRWSMMSWFSFFSFWRGTERVLNTKRTGDLYGLMMLSFVFSWRVCVHLSCRWRRAIPSRTFCRGPWRSSERTSVSSGESLRTKNSTKHGLISSFPHVRWYSYQVKVSK